MCWWCGIETVKRTLRRLTPPVGRLSARSCPPWLTSNGWINSTSTKKICRGKPNCRTATRGGDYAAAGRPDRRRPRGVRVDSDLAAPHLVRPPRRRCNYCITPFPTTPRQLAEEGRTEEGRGRGQN